MSRPGQSKGAYLFLSERYVSSRSEGKSSDMSQKRPRPFNPCEADIFGLRLLSDSDSRPSGLPCHNVPDREVFPS